MEFDGFGTDGCVLYSLGYILWRLARSIVNIFVLGGASQKSFNPYMSCSQGFRYHVKPGKQQSGDHKEMKGLFNAKNHNYTKA